MCVVGVGCEVSEACASELAFSASASGLRCKCLAAAPDACRLCSTLMDSNILEL